MHVIEPHESGLTYRLDLLEGSGMYTPAGNKQSRQLPINGFTYGYFIAGAGHFTERDQVCYLYQIFITHKGKGKFLVDGREYIMGPNTMALL